MRGRVLEMNGTPGHIEAVLFAIVGHSGYVVYRTVSIRDDLGLEFWDTLRVVATSELPLLPIFMAVAILLNWIRRSL